EVTSPGGQAAQDEVDEIEVYGSEAQSGTQLATFSFEVCDSILNIGPCANAAMGEPAFLSEEFQSSPEPDLEIVLCSGYGKNGALTVLQILQTGQEIMELDTSGFATQGPTVDTVDDEEEMLYGDSGTLFSPAREEPRRGANPPAERQPPQQRPEPTHWCVLVRENGAMEVSGTGDTGGTGAPPEPPLPAVGLGILVGLGHRQSRPYLLVHVEQELLIYEAFGHDSQLGQNNLKVRFKKGELRISVLPAYLSYDAPWPVRKIPLRCTAHYVAYHVESKVARHVATYRDISRHIATYRGVYHGTSRHTRTYRDMSGHIAAYIAAHHDIPEHIATYRDILWRISRHTTTYHDMSRHTATCCDISRHVTTYHDMSRQIATYCDISRHTATYRGTL
ncbi:hypothetical protein Q9233_017639, partial [Columba guinea]